MLTALGLACVMWLPSQQSCAGGGCGGGGGFPMVSCDSGCRREWNLCHKGDCWGLLFTKCVCPIGVSVPCGDFYAQQMSQRYAAPIVITAPAGQAVGTLGAPPPVVTSP